MTETINKLTLRNMLFELGNRSVFVGLDVETEPKVKAGQGAIVKKARINGRAGAKYRQPTEDHVTQKRSWGNRLAESPLVEYKGTYYLEMEVTSSPEVSYFDKETGEPITEDEAKARGYRKRDDQYLMVFRDYKLDSIKKIRINKKEFTIN